MDKDLTNSASLFEMGKSQFSREENLAFGSKEKLKKGQMLYFTSVMLIFIGFAFFGIFLMQHNFLTGNVISDVNLPTDCSDATIQGIWSDIFWESSIGISIIKNNSLTGGKCSEYFATKHNTNEFNDTHILYGWTKNDGGKNVSYILAERINMTSLYWDSFLKNITHIENVSALSLEKNNLFFENYVNLRIEGINSPNSQDIFNKTFEMNQSETWASEDYLNNLTYSFSSDFIEGNYDISAEGKIVTNYSYTYFSFVSTPVDCSFVPDCDSWSTCLNGYQNRTCTNSSSCYADVVYNATRNCTTCVANWSTGNWSSCFNGTQTRTVVDFNSCGNLVGKPAGNKTCEEGCVPDWNCGIWEPVICPSTGIQKRNCTDENSCGETFKIETQSCGVTATSKPISTSGENSNAGFSFLFIFITIFVVLIIIGLIIWLVFLMKKKNDSGNKNGVNAFSAKPPFNPPAPLQFSMMKKISSPMKKIIPQKFVRPFSKPLSAPINTTKNFLPTENKKQIVQPIKEKPVINNMQKVVPKNSQKSVWNSLRDISRNSRDGLKK